MKKSLFVLLIVTMMLPVSIFSQSFETDRIPIGDPDRKFDFCSVKMDKVFDTKQMKDKSFDELIDALKENRIVMIGETHTNQMHHDVQFDIIKGLTEAGKPVVLALEMYNPKQDRKLAKWSKGKTDPNTFLKQTDFLTTWSHNYRYYKAIFDYCREKHIPIYGANIDRKYSSRIGKVGIKGLTKKENKAIPEVDTLTAEHKFFFKVAMQGMDATMPKIFNNMYQAQSLWDAAMGEGAIKAAKKHPDATVIVLAGSGHVIYNLGIGRIIKDRSDLSFASVVTVDVPEEIEESGMMKIKKEKQKKMTKDMSKMTSKDTENKESEMNAAPKMGNMMGGMPAMDTTPYRIVVRSLADYLWGKKEMEHEKYPAFGFSMEDNKEKGYLIKRVLPETIAAENGLKTGDIILSIDDKEFSSYFELKKYMHYKSWEDTISFQINRNSEMKTVAFTIKPIEEEE